MSTETTDIVLEPEVQDFTSPQELRAAFEIYKKECEKKYEMRTIPGLCRALNISRETYLNYRKSEDYGKDFEQVELSMEHEWLQKLRSPNNSGAIFYLKNAYRQFYKEEEQQKTPLNMIFNVEQLNLIARRIVAHRNESAESPDRLSSGDQSEISS